MYVYMYICIYEWQVLDLPKMTIETHFFEMEKVHLPLSSHWSPFPTSSLFKRASHYRGASVIRKTIPVGPYSSPGPSVLW